MHTPPKATINERVILKYSFEEAIVLAFEPSKRFDGEYMLTVRTDDGEEVTVHESYIVRKSEAVYSVISHEVLSCGDSTIYLEGMSKDLGKAKQILQRSKQQWKDDTGKEDEYVLLIDEDCHFCVCADGDYNNNHYDVEIFVGELE